MKKIKISKLEKLIYTLAVFVLLLTPFVSIFGQATISKINIEVERLKTESVTMENSVEALNIRINELASFENVTAVAETMGLAYNNDNIINVK